MKTVKLLLAGFLLAGCGDGAPPQPPPRPTALLASSVQAQPAHGDMVQLLYIASMGRPADPAGLAYWANALALSGAPAHPGALLDAYASQPAARIVVDGIAGSREAELANSPADAELIDAVYRNLANRSATSSERDMWSRRIASGELSRPQAVLAIIATTASTAAASVAGKLAAARSFSAHIDNPQLRPLYRGLLAVGAVRRALAGVAASSDPAQAALAMAAAMSGAVTSNLGKPQTIWFAPADTAVRTWAGDRNGSDDYMALFAPDAPWTQAAGRIHIFKMYSNVFLLPHLPGSLTDEQIRTVLADLKRRNIALAVEHGPLYEDPAPPHCGTGIEGFGGSASLRLAQRIRDLGGELRYLAMDEPFQHARDVCGWSAQQVAANAAASVAEIRKVFPDVLVGDIEVVPGSAAMPDWFEQYGLWMDAWKSASGRPLAFFHADINWGIHYGDAIARARQLARERGIPFGVIYNGWHTDRSDAEWTASGMRNYASVELGAEPPEQAIFQSWDHYPERVLPETSPSSFTYLVNSYFRTRTAMAVAAGNGIAHGVLEDAAGNPLSGRQVKLSAQPVDGRGVAGIYTLSGTVPLETVRALIQVCINQCGEAGTNDMSLYSFGYFDTGGRFAGRGFAEGWSRWGTDATGTASLVIGSDAQGSVALHTSATASQRTYINSVPFSVTPGASFSLTIRARISPASVGSGSFSLIFLKDTEHSRKSLAFQPALLSLGSGTTGADGSYRIAYAVPAGAMAVRAEYAGDAQYWPALASSMTGK